MKLETDIDKHNFIKGLYAIIDGKFLCGRTYEMIAEEAILGGADIIQLRDRELLDKELLEVSLRLRKIVKKYDKIFIVNDRIDICLASGADGVHLGQDDLPVKVARRLLENKIIGKSTHSLTQAVEAEEEGVNYIGVGPIFRTTTKDAGEPVGINLIREVKEKVKIPVVAIGGINSENVFNVLDAGVDAVAVVSSVCAAVDVRKSAEELTEKIKEKRKNI